MKGSRRSTARSENPRWFIHTRLPSEGPETNGRRNTKNSRVLMRRTPGHLIAYERLEAKRARELGELRTRPYEDIAMKEFLEKVRGPHAEGIHELMGTSGRANDT